MTETTTVRTWTGEDVIAVIRELAKQQDLPGHLVDAEISETDTVESLGIDSLGGAYLVERFEELTGVLMPDDFVELDFNIKEIAARLNRLVEEQG